jgi:hypothetical protein
MPTSKILAFLAVALGLSLPAAAQPAVTDSADGEPQPWRFEAPALSEERRGELPPEARQFDFWRGQWDVNLRIRQEDGSWPDKVAARARIYSVLAGKAVLELWDSAPNKVSRCVTSIRPRTPGCCGSTGRANTAPAAPG